jgi:CheY-like chemotaxis protein
MSMNGRRRRILVADDLRDAADMVVELLRLQGYDAQAAYDGLHAVELARSFKPDLALLDIDMPVMDGYVAAKLLRQEQSRGAPLVLIAHTGRTTPADARTALQAGFDRHIAKPLVGDLLCELVAAYLPMPVVPNDPAVAEGSTAARRVDDIEATSLRRSDVGS